MLCVTVRRFVKVCSLCVRKGLGEITFVEILWVFVVQRFKYLMLTLWGISLFTFDRYNI